MIFQVKYDTHTPTWDGLGKMWMGEADSYDTAVASAQAEAAQRFPEAEIRNLTVTEAHPATFRAYQIRQQQIAIWTANMAVGAPNGRSVLP